MYGGYNNFSCYQFNSRPVVESLRNPYEQDFRAPLGYPPRPRCSPGGYSPRHSPQNTNFRHHKPYSQLEDNLPQNPNFTSKVSPYGRNSFYISTPPSTTPNSASPLNRSRSSGFANRSSFTPTNSFKNRRHNRYSFNDSNPGGSSNIHDYYNPMIFRDPWVGLKPVKAKPKQATNL